MSIYVGKIRHPPLIRMSNVISSGFAVVSKARVAWDGTASFGSPCAAVLSGCQGFSSIFLPGRGLWPSLPAGQLSTASCARRRPYDKPRYVEPMCCICVFSFGVHRTTSPAAIAAIRRLRKVIVMVAHDPAHPLDGVVVPVPLDKCDDYFSVRSSSAWAKTLRPT